MRIGLAALGIGSGAQPEVVAAVARAAETSGFATLWCGEHVVLVDEPRSRYPYASDGRLAVGSDTDWLDPLVALSYAAAVTRDIRLGTGVLLLPEHQPALVAKQAASVDHLSGGRLVLGIGTGWSAEEFAALGVPFESRGARTDEYLEVLRVLWGGGAASHHGAHLSFSGVRCRPRPRNGRIPVLIGGTSDAALRRAARRGDGWYGFALSLTEVRERTAVLRRLCSEAGRDPDELEVVVAPFTAPVSPDDVGALEACGVSELVIVDSPPSSAADVAPWVGELAARWGAG